MIDSKLAKEKLRRMQCWVTHDQDTLGQIADYIESLEVQLGQLKQKASYCENCGRLKVWDRCQC